MLINLSNHPSGKWTHTQLQTAKQQFGRVEDISFPNVNPTDSLQQIALIADQYLKKILKSEPDAVHIMGEFTFTYILVNKLREHHIPCLASTTERKVEELDDGSRRQTFQFVQFRPYFTSNPV